MVHLIYFLYRINLNVVLYQLRKITGSLSLNVVILCIKPLLTAKVKHIISKTCMQVVWLARPSHVSARGDELQRGVYFVMQVR